MNKELRSLRAAFRYGAQRDLIPKVPIFEMLPTDKPRPKILLDEDFAKLLENCGEATRPKGLPIPAAEWWTALLIFLRYTGWRIGEALSLRWADLEEEAGQWWATSEAPDNKGGRTERIPLIPLVIDHLERIRTLASLFVFPWALTHKALYHQLSRIAQAAGVTFPTSGHKTDKFHSLRKTFGTRAAMAGIDPKALASLMRHTDVSVTQKYYLDAEALMAQAVAKIQVSPRVLEVAG